MENTNTTLFHDTRRAKKNGNYPVKIRLTYNRKQKYFPTNYDLTEHEFKKLYAKRVNQEFRETFDNIWSMLTKASDIVKKLPVFDWRKFEREFLTPRTDAMSVYSAYDKQIKKFESSGQSGIHIDYVIRSLGHTELIADGKGKPLDTLGQTLANGLGCKYQPDLIRKNRTTVPMHTLCKWKRFYELDGVFYIAADAAINDGKSFLIIDDVIRL